jgi:hypothetical protein
MYLLLNSILWLNSYKPYYYFLSDQHLLTSIAIKMLEILAISTFPDMRGKFKLLIVSQLIPILCKLVETRNNTGKFTQEKFRIHQLFHKKTGACHQCMGVFILMTQNALLTGFQLPHCQGTQFMYLQK